MAAPLPVPAALALLQREALPLPPEARPLAQAAGLVSARTIHAPRDLPPYDNSQMDGYALCLPADAAAWPAQWPVIGELPAGTARTLALAQGQAARVFTGSPLPAGANAVVMQEVVAREGDAIVLQELPQPGQFIRCQGSDIAQGSSALAAGQELTPAAIGLLASLGVRTVDVHRPPRLALLTSGDELVPPETEPLPHQLIEGNTLMLQTACRPLVAAAPEIVRVPDEVNRLTAELDRLLQVNEVVFTTGGVSVGTYDYLHEAIRRLGVQVHFWRIAQRPGKPLLYGRRGSTHLLCLPGNPVSTLACFYIYGWLLLRALRGHPQPQLPRRMAALTADAAGGAGLTLFMRGHLADDGQTAQVTPLEAQGSHQLSTFTRANALIVLPAGTGRLRKGAMVECVVLPV